MRKNGRNKKYGRRKTFYFSISQKCNPSVHELSSIYALNSYSHSGEDLKSTYTKNFIDTFNSSLNEIGM